MMDLTTTRAAIKLNAHHRPRNPKFKVLIYTSLRNNDDDSKKYALLKWRKNFFKKND